jgi:hypothetical protein
MPRGERTKTGPGPEPPDGTTADPAGTAAAHGRTSGPGDSTESFLAVDSGASQRLFPPAPAEGGTRFGAARPPPDENAFRLFPPGHESGRRPAAPAAEDDD